MQSFITAGTVTLPGGGSVSLRLGPYPPGSTISYLTVCVSAAPTAVVRMAPTIGSMPLFFPTSAGLAPIVATTGLIIPVHIPLWIRVPPGSVNERTLNLLFSTAGAGMDVSAWAALRAH